MLERAAVAASEGKGGYCFRGSFVVNYDDGEEETVCAGEAYFMRPGHRRSTSRTPRHSSSGPHDELQKVMEVVARNMQAAEPQQG